MISKAQNFAKTKHGNATRKSSGLPYYTHPFAVAKRLSQIPEVCDQTCVIVAAYLHDVLEDTETTFDEIVNEFDETIANLVKELTSDKKMIKQDTQYDPEAKAKYLTNKINLMSKEARVIKLADREDNVSDLQDCDENFSKKYARETLYIINHIEVELERYEIEIVNSIQRKIFPFIPETVIFKYIQKRSDQFMHNTVSWPSATTYMQ